MKIMTETGEVKEALFDGYAIGDRILEGVMFRVVLTSKGLECPGVIDSDKSYMEQFSTKKIREWRQDVLDAVVNDGGMSTSTGQEAWIEVEPDPFLEGIMERSEPRQIVAKSGDAFLESLKDRLKSG